MEADKFSMFYMITSFTVVSHSLLASYSAIYNSCLQVAGLQLNSQSEQTIPHTFSFCNNKLRMHNKYNLYEKL